ncbi:MAG TPA: 2-amino-4-hydroxy-6-hydroxymethyldihydropteridine diphosphokinase [Castellaniella sp.]|uniref:2-amino-4-hydroxy-6- hydroxymethyldihydropteridine diphosphokinase n=1 Tax=Castellaniella sp. TaxID=1955812 RepID=UPI002F0A549B
MAERAQTAAVLAYVGLGANLGNAAATVRAAANELAQAHGIGQLQLSSLYETTPIDSSGPNYVNAVAQIHTRLEPLALLQTLQAIEAAHGRTRPYHNAPRTLDLDLLWYDGRSLNEPTLVVPHPRMHERAFVLQPLQELAGDLMLAQGSLTALLRHCGDQGIHRLD